MKSVTYRIETITPQQAQDILDTSAGNRVIRRSMVIRFAEEMASGKWVLNGEPILISDTGKLIEGHHRMHACIRSNTPFTTAVGYGISDAVFATINTGGTRSPGDVFNIAGVRNANNASSVVNKVLQYKHSVGKTSINQWNVPFMMTKAKLLEVYNQDKEGYDEAVKKAKSVYDALPSTLPSITGAMHYLFSSVDAYLADEFINGLITGANLSAQSPMMKLRNVWIKRDGAKRRSGADEMMVITCHAWRAFINGREIGVLRHNNTHPIPDYK